VPISMMAPLNVSRSTIAAQSRGSVKVLVQPENSVASDSNGVLFLALGKNLEQQLCTATVRLGGLSLL
jgi:hypothetical protein